MKTRIALEYNKYVRKSENRSFPPGKEKEIDASKAPTGANLTKVQDFMGDQNVEELIDTAIDRIVYVKKGNSVTYIHPTPGGNDASFDETTMTSDRLIVRKSTGTYSIEEAVGKIGKIKATKNKRQIIIELIKDHIYG